MGWAARPRTGLFVQVVSENSPAIPGSKRHGARVVSGQELQMKIRNRSGHNLLLLIDGLAARASARALGHNMFRTNMLCGQLATLAAGMLCGQLASRAPCLLHARACHRRRHPAGRTGTNSKTTRWLSATTAGCAPSRLPLRRIPLRASSYSPCRPCVPSTSVDSAPFSSLREWWLSGRGRGGVVRRHNLASCRVPGPLSRHTGTF